ncbi:hypothetical protein [Aquimarina agarivorans]|uniref:hypothetical protein n=1 Tax=Aquimarina agarivorans TaxID=980584 RepID=UPI000248E684|nr:hypothetical protein [Aquimarina agarivorans]
MKNIQISTILQIVSLIFLAIIGYLVFNSSSNWKVVKSELKNAKEELKVSKDMLTSTKVALEKSKKDFKKLKAQKDLIIHRRDSLILSFKRKNAKDWNELQHIKDSIKITNYKLAKDQAILNSIFGLDQ